MLKRKAGRKPTVWWSKAWTTEGVAIRVNVNNRIVSIVHGTRDLRRMQIPKRFNRRRRHGQTRFRLMFDILAIPCGLCLLVFISVCLSLCCICGDYQSGSGSRVETREELYQQCPKRGVSRSCQLLICNAYREMRNESTQAHSNIPRFDYIFRVTFQERSAKVQDVCMHNYCLIQCDGLQRISEHFGQDNIETRSVQNSIHRPQISYPNKV